MIQIAKKYFFAIGLALLSGLASGEWRIDARGVGPLRFGMSLNQVNRLLKSHLHQPEVAGIDATGRYFTVELENHGDISLMFIDLRLARVDVDKPGLKTVGSIQVGNSASVVIQKVRPVPQVQQHFYVNTGLYLTSLALDGKRGIRFEVIDGKVSTYYAGLLTAIQQVEGCS